ncbi:MAG: hypothetical protein ACI8XM_003019, partial [Haloarculaceae archaeon]
MYTGAVVGTVPGRYRRERRLRVVIRSNSPVWIGNR